MNLDELLSGDEDALMQEMNEPKKPAQPAQSTVQQQPVQQAPQQSVQPTQPVQQQPVQQAPQQPVMQQTAQPVQQVQQRPVQQQMQPQTDQIDAVQAIVENDTAANTVDELATSPEPAPVEVVKKEIFEKLNPKDQALAQKVSTQLNYQKRDSIMKYGNKVTKNIDQFSKRVLESADREDGQKNVKDDLDAIIKVLRSTNVHEMLEEPEPQQEPEHTHQGGFFGGLLKRKPVENKLVQNDKVSKFRDVSQRIDVLKEKMTIDQKQLIKDTEMLKQLYDQNLTFFKALNVFIAGLEVYQEKMLTQDIPALQQELAQTNDGLIAEKIQVAQKYVDAVERKIYDFRTVRQVSLNQAPAIRLIQDNNVNLVDKIQSSIMITLPTWRTNFVTVLTMLHQRAMAQTQRDVNDLTNDLLKESSDLLHTTSVETAKENERATIEIETLEYTQNQLIQSIDETMAIQREGREKRIASTQRLNELEGQLKDKLLEISRGEGR